MSEASGNITGTDVYGPFRLRAEPRAVLYPNAYVWYVFAAALDIMITWIILHAGGSELNALADWIIRRYDRIGVVLFKFGVVVLVLLICELAGRRNRRLGLALACWAVALTAFPVVVGLLHLVAAFLNDTW